MRHKWILSADREAFESKGFMNISLSISGFFSASFFLNFEKGSKHIIFSHEDFLPTAIYSYLLKKLNVSARWIAMFHMKSPSIFKGFEGEYTNRKRFPSIRIVRYKLEQWIFFKLAKNNATKVITVNAAYEEICAERIWISIR